jgi:hypothetical protein
VILPFFVLSFAGGARRTPSARAVRSRGARPDFCAEANRPSLRCIDGAGGSTAYRTASILRNNRAVSNVKGNTYRLVVAVKYEFQIVYIRFVGTHAAYDNIKAEEV